MKKLRLAIMLIITCMFGTLFQCPHAIYAAMYEWPVSTKYDISCGFYESSLSGVDFDVPLGTPVYASARGIATVVDRGCRGSHLPYGSPTCSKGSSCDAWRNGGTYGGYGNFVKIVQSDGIVSYYCHLKTGIPVANGSAVVQGQVIGYSGCTGDTKGPSLHFEMRKNGVMINPEDYLTKSNTSTGTSSTGSTKKYRLLIPEENSLSSCSGVRIGHIWKLTSGSNNVYKCEYCGEEEELLRGDGSIIYMGVCGDKCYWSVSKSGVLRIWGSGDMYDYGIPKSGTTYSDGKMKLGIAPWMVFCSPKINSIQVENGITSISDGAFVCVNFEKKEEFSDVRYISDISLPDTIERIGTEAFWGIASDCLTIPRNVKNWSEKILYNAHINTVTFSEGIKNIYKVGQNNVTKFILPSSVTTLSENAFMSSGLLETINLPDGITEIPQKTFSGCAKLKNIIIPTSVSTIGQYAFENCDSLTTITVPSGVTNISYGAFSECKNLKSIMIPESVAVLDHINISCDKLTDIYYEGSEVSWKKIAISGLEHLDNVMIHYAKAAPTVTISVDQENPLAGENVCLTAKVEGEEKNYSYSFLIHNLENDSWYRWPFDKDKQLVWTANGTGAREFFAEAKDSEGVVIRSDAMKITVKEESSPLSIIGKASEASVSAGNTVIISATATGGTGAYTYSFLIHNLENDSWYRWAFDKSTQFTWTANGSGNREFFAEVKDSEGTVVRSSAIKVTVKSTSTPLTITGNVSASQVAAGNTVTVSATAAGGTGTYTYSFLIHNLENDSWYRWAFDKSAQLTWTANGSGNREFFAEAKDTAGTVVRSTAMKVTVGNGSSEGTLQITASADKNQVVSGETITIQATATGGSGSYTYSFLVHNLANDSWYRFGDFTEASSYVWNAGSAGTREFFVEVKDSNGTVVRSSAAVITVK